MFDKQRVDHARQLVRSRRRYIHALLEDYARRSAMTGPCNRAKAEAAVRAVYHAANFEPPRFIWHDSPFDAAKSFAVLAYVHSLRSIAPDLLQAARGENTDEIISEIRSEQGRLTVGFTDHTVRMRTALSQQALAEIRETQSYQWFHTPAVAGELKQAIDRLERIPNFSDYGRIDTLLSFIRSALNDGTNPAARLGSGDAWQLGIIGTCSMLGYPPGRAFEPMLETMHECGWWWPMLGFCIMCERPSDLYFEGYELHRLNAPAVMWENGPRLFFIKDLHVPSHVACGQFTARDIELEGNVEVRMAMLHVFGMDRYLNESNAQCVQADDFGELYRIHLGEDAEDVCIVRVTNSTPEADGTHKDYILRVPPRIKTAREAVAWTFAMDEDEYCPRKET